MKSKYEEYTIEQRIEDLKDIVAIQCSPGNYDCEYMRGMANGLLLAENIILKPYGTEIVFKEPIKKVDQT